MSGVRTVLRIPERYPDWVPGATIAIACGVIYLALRPPLFDFDGYMYRMYALQPDRFQETNPHHLLWNSVQILLAYIANASGYPTTVPFQIFGILINCTTLFVFYSLLWKTNGDLLVAGSAVLLVAFSPAFWYLGSQNEPYPLAFLAMVLYLGAWHTKDGGPPRGLRLLAAGLSLTAAIFFQQAVITLVPAAVVVMVIFSRERTGYRLVRGFAWGASIAAFVLGAYFFFWRISEETQGLFRWSTDYLESVHPLQLFQLGFLVSFARSIIGLSGSLVQSEGIQSFLALNFSPRAILTLYGLAGLAACVGVAMLGLWADLSRRLLQLTRSALFTVSILSVICWWAFAFAWEAATPHYWVLGHFPALLCLGMLLRERPRYSKWVFAASITLLSTWNIYQNNRYDKTYSRNFPEPLLASIRQHVGAHDIFIVLGNDDWFGGMNYDLLFRCLRYSSGNPGLAILNDFVIPAVGSESWNEHLRDKIEATLDSGGKVFVAAHLFNPKAYADLSATNDPFTEQINEQYLAINGPAIYQEVWQLFGHYRLEKSDFKIGLDAFFIAQHRTTASYRRSVDRLHKLQGKRERPGITSSVYYLLRARHLFANLS